MDVFADVFADFETLLAADGTTPPSTIVTPDRAIRLT